MSDKPTLTWIPFYEELAFKVVGYRTRQTKLLEFLGTLRAQGLKVILLDDQTGSNNRIPLSVIDPFTFFAAFNRSTNIESKIPITNAIRVHFGIVAQPPSDFEGIPTVNNQSSWFFPYQDQRQAGDIDSLWDLAEDVVLRAAVSPEHFDRCLQILTVGTAKLTQGLYWLCPKRFLPCDQKTLTLLASLGLSDGVQPENHAEYQTLVDRVSKYLGTDFVGISHEAFHRIPSTSYWAGGHLWNEPHGGSQLDRFIADKCWELGYNPDDSREPARAAWSLLRRVRVGDMLAIKGYGGQNDLQVHRVGVVERVDLPKKTLHLKWKEVPLYHGKGPGGAGAGSWFGSLVEVKRPDIIKLLFEQTSAEPITIIPAKVEQPPIPLNLILYGPPGTGKTYEMRAKLARYFSSDEKMEEPADSASATWFELVAVALQSLGGKATVPQLAKHLLLVARHIATARTSPLSNQVWATLQSHTVQSSKTVNYERRTDPLIFDKTEEGVWSFAGNMDPDLRERLEEVQKAHPNISTRTERPRPRFVTFHQSFAYEDFIEGIRPSLEDNGGDSRLEFERRPGVFMQACTEAIAAAGFEGSIHDFCLLPVAERQQKMAAAPAHVLFIDEINRGNVSRIFGELITLIEDDKRLGAPREMIVTLPGSGRYFGVPANLYVIGTMNTADRSVEALDAALRRRFSFKEVPPDPATLDGIDVEGIDLRQMFETINGRLRRVYDREHLIGHSYFMSLKETAATERLSELRQIFQQRVLPLLQEYFFHDYAKIGLVLGPKWVRESAHAKVDLAEFEDERRDDLGDGRILELADPAEASAADFIAIYSRE